MLVNDMIHGLFPEAITIGEDVSDFYHFIVGTKVFRAYIYYNTHSDR